MKKFRFHLLSLAHLPQHRKFISCAFSQKNRKLARMLTSLNHTVYFYGCEGSDVEEYCKNEPGRLIFVQTHTLKDLWRDYGEGWNLDDYPSLHYNFYNQDYKHDLNSERKLSTINFYNSCIGHINRVKKDDDFLLCTQGLYHKPIADAVKLFLTLESGIGYRGSCSSMFRCFESSYIQNFTYGSEHPLQSINGSYYDRVIPNYFDSADVEYSDKKGDYYLFMGRLIKRKGILTAYLATKALGAKLLIAGQGGIVKPNGHLVDNHPQEFDIPPDSDWEYLGFADLNKRKSLLSKAIALFSPTEYLECFAGIHVEAMLSGTPPITTNFGVFPETIPNVLNGRIGFRCNTLNDFVRAAVKAKGVNHEEIRGYGEKFLMDNVKWQYQQWFEDLYNVYQSAHDPKKRGWHRLDKQYMRRVTIPSRGS